METVEETLPIFLAARVLPLAAARVRAVFLRAALCGTCADPMPARGRRISEVQPSRGTSASRPQKRPPISLKAERVDVEAWWRGAAWRLAGWPAGPGDHAELPQYPPVPQHCSLMGRCMRPHQVHGSAWPRDPAYRSCSKSLQVQHPVAAGACCHVPMAGKCLGYVGGPKAHPSEESPRPQDFVTVECHV